MANPAPVVINNLLLGGLHPETLHAGPVDVNGVAQDPNNSFVWAGDPQVSISPFGSFGKDAHVFSNVSGTFTVTATVNGPLGPLVATFILTYPALPFDHLVPSADPQV